MIVASFNIEKNGISSEWDKQTVVSGFVDKCCSGDGYVDVLFLCEVHSARIGNYVDFLSQMYGYVYDVTYFDGGYSNAYVVLTKRTLGSRDQILSYNDLKYLNRKVVLVTPAVPNPVFVILAHFKSGQNGLTKDQVQNAARAGEEMNAGHWAIMGDMNWDYRNRNQLNLPGGSHADTCWANRTQKSGGILDWCLAGGAVGITPYAFNNNDKLEYNMEGPDHRPVIFTLNTF